MFCVNIPCFDKCMFTYGVVIKCDTFGQHIHKVNWFDYQWLNQQKITPKVYSVIHIYVSFTFIYIYVLQGYIHNARREHIIAFPLNVRFIISKLLCLSDFIFHYFPIVPSIKLLKLSSIIYNIYIMYIFYTCIEK